MNWDRINVWTNTLYTLIHSLNLSKQIYFGNLSTISESVINAGKWLVPECSYNSVLVVHPFGRSKVTFRRDPNKHFDEIAGQLVKMLVQDLVVILDEMLLDVLLARSLTAPNFAQAKVHKLKQYLPPQYEWAAQGCLELIAARNVLTHAGGHWNAQSILIVSPFVNPIPSNGEKLIIGLPMLFRYRKAMRTFLNEVKM
jgi:hypothetical protein